MTGIPLTLATWDYDRVRPLIDGRVTVEGCTLNHIALAPEECFHRAHFHREFDAFELGFSYYLNSVARGDRSIVAVPVFLSRMFRHSAIYIRDDRGISSPQDLAGKRVGVPEYQMTAAIWVRGLLRDQYGLAYDSMEWVEGGLEQYGRRSKIVLTLPDGFPLSPVPEGQNLSAMLEHGELDAVVSPRAPSCYTRRAPHIRRLFEDYKTAEQAYYRETGIFPIMHAVGIRAEVVEQHPWLPASLFKGFEAAKRIADRDLAEVIALKIGLPWVAHEYSETRAVMGDDFWSYGVEPNRKTLEALARYAHEQGVAGRAIAVDELFAPSTVAMSKI